MAKPQPIQDLSERLNGHLWEAANILRGPVEAPDFKTGRAQNELLPEHLQRIHDWVRDYADVEASLASSPLTRLPPTTRISPYPRYVEPKVTSEVLTVGEARKRLRESAEAASAAGDNLLKIFVKNRLLGARQ